MITSKINTIIPHDPSVSTFPFSDIPITPKFKRIYKKLNAVGVLGKLEQNILPPDVPQIYVYRCERPSGKRATNVSYGFGGSEDESTAAEHAISEAVEHYCILNERPKLFEKEKYKKLQFRALDPLIFSPFTEKQLSLLKYKKFRLNHDTTLNWLPGLSLLSKKEILIPASLTYANYSSTEHNEPIIQMPISTGAACGTDLDSAVYRGLCEIIERDAYMISFLPDMPKRLIKIEKDDSDLHGLVQKFERYRFEIYFMDTTLDSGIFSVACLLLDPTGCGPSVCAGLGAGLNIKQAIKTSAIEALRRYVSNRNAFFRATPPKDLQRYSFEWLIRKRQKIWSAPHMISRVRSIIKNSTIVKLSDTKKIKQTKDKLTYVLDNLKKIGCDSYYTEMTTPEIQNLGLRVVKTFIPKMVPLWRDDRYPYLGFERLHQIPSKYDVKIKLGLISLNLENSHPF